MVLRNMAGAGEADHRHAGGQGGRHAGLAILHHEAAGRRDAALPCREQIDIGRRLRPGNPIGAEDGAADPRRQPRSLHRELDPVAAAVRGDRDGQADLLQRLAHAADRGGFALERLDDRLIQAFEEPRRQGLVQMSREALQDVRGLQPEAARQSRCQIPPGIGLAQHVHQDAIADDLAVDDHPVAVADQQIEGARGVGQDS